MNQTIRKRPILSLKIAKPEPIAEPKTETQTPPNPDRAARARQRRHDTVAAFIAAWPKAFDLNAPLPLAIGIHEAIAEAMPELSKAHRSKALGWWTARRKYRAALTATGAMRHDLDGNPVEPVNLAEESRAEGARTPQSAAPSPCSA